MNENETNRGFQGVTEVCSGYISFREMAWNIFGKSPKQVKNSYPFFDWDFYNPASANLMPIIDLADILAEYYSEADSPVFLGTMTRSAGFATAQSYIRSVESVGSMWPISQNGPGDCWWMEQSSYETGPMRVRKITKERQLANRDNLIRDVKITRPNSGSLMIVNSPVL